MQKILIVEDDEKIAFALCLRLKAHGYATWIASDGVSAMSKAARCRPDLIIMDIALPAGNGLDLAEHFKKIPDTRRIPVIFATASQDPYLRQKALERGAVGLLRKPYEPEALASLVKHALASCRSPATASPRLDENLRLGSPIPRPQALSLSCLPRQNAVAGEQRAGLPSEVLLTKEGVIPPKKTSAKRILIVEDDQKVALALAVRMRSAGFDTTIANDALSGVRSALADHPDAVVLDISLPAGDGFSVAQRIQTQIPIPIPMIFLTASKRADFRQKARDLGAVAFFEKPYEAEGLVAALRHATA